MKTIVVVTDDRGEFRVQVDYTGSTADEEFGEAFDRALREAEINPLEVADFWPA